LYPASVALSTWDMLAPAYWTTQQANALTANRRERLGGKVPLRARDRRILSAWTSGSRRAWTNAAILLNIIAAAAVGDVIEKQVLDLNSAWAASTIIAATLMVIAIRTALPRPVPAECHMARALRVNSMRLVEATAPERSAYEIGSRVNAWIDVLDSSPKGKGFAASLRSMDRVTAGLTAAMLALCSVGVVLLAIDYAFPSPRATTPRLGTARPDRGFPCAWQLTILAPIVTHSYFVARRRKRLRGALAQVNCPDCGYDLRDCAPAIAREGLGGFFIGPERCPECGSLWPLLPPPVSPTGCAVVPRSV
jgi:hypothetical protein